MAPNNNDQKPRSDYPKGSDTATKKSIKKIKDQYCNSLKTLIGNLQEAEENNRGLQRVYHQKKCFFVKSEKNYRTVRNLELSVGVELIQASEEIKTNLTEYIADNTNLVKAIGEILKSVKVAKASFADLKKASCNLDDCRKDSCNKSQMIILTGSSFDCPDNGNNNLPPDCENAGAILDELVSTPESLFKDVDVIFGACSDVAGIQTFSNIPALLPFQTDLSAKAKLLDDFIQNKIKTDTEALKKAQDDLIAATKDLTKASHAVYNRRNELDAVKGTKDYLCHGNCNCITDGDERLKECKVELCEICQSVTDTYCKSGNDGGPQTTVESDY